MDAIALLMADLARQAGPELVVRDFSAGSLFGWLHLDGPPGVLRALALYRTGRGVHLPYRVVAQHLGCSVHSRRAGLSWRAGYAVGTSEWHYAESGVGWFHTASGYVCFDCWMVGSIDGAACNSGRRFVAAPLSFADEHALGTRGAAYRIRRHMLLHADEKRTMREPE